MGWSKYILCVCFSLGAAACGMEELTEGTDKQKETDKKSTVETTKTKNCVSLKSLFLYAGVTPPAVSENFITSCAMAGCHTDHGIASMTGANSADALISKARRGGGAMPKFSVAEISDDTLKADYKAIVAEREVRRLESDRLIKEKAATTTTTNASTVTTSKSTTPAATSQQSDCPAK
jgi:hypothetical protein